jgi:hypothetical protein
VSHSHISLERKLKMKASSLLLGLVVAASASVAFAAPSTLQNNHYWTDADNMVYGPKVNPGVLKVNPGVLKQHGAIKAGGAQGASAAMTDDYCGNGIKPIPGVNPVGNSLRRGGLAMNDIEPCGTRVPGRIPGGVGPVGPR